MGRSKSWLALVLAIVMVLGMAVPTAFAEGVTAKGAGNVIGGGITFTGGTSAQELIIGEEDAAVTINTNPSGAVNFYLKETDPNWVLGQRDRYVPFSTSEFTLTAGSGSFTVTPHSMTELNGKKFWVTVDLGNDWYEAEFTVKVLPVIKADKAIVELDKNEAKNMTNTTIGFSTKNAPGTLVMDGRNVFRYYDALGRLVGTGVSSGKEPMLHVGVERPTPDSNYFTYTLSNASPVSIVGEGYIGFTGKVNGVPTKELRVPYKVSDSRLVGNNRPYRVGPSINDVVIDRNRQISDITFKPYYYDVQGNQVYPTFVTNPSDTTPGLSVVTSTITAVSQDPDLVTVSSYNTASGEFTLGWPAIANAKPSGTTEIWIFTGGVLSGKLKVTVNPIYVTASPNTFTLNLANGGLKSQAIKLATTGTTGDNVVNFDVSTGTPVAGPRPGSQSGNTYTATTTSVSGSGKLTFSNITLDTGIGLIPVPDCTVNYNVVNTSAVTREMTAKFALNDSPLAGYTVDLGSITNNAVSMVFTPVAMAGQENQFARPRDSLTMTGLPSSFAIGNPSILQDGSLKYEFTTSPGASALGTFDVTFGGTLDGNTIKPITIPITIKDGTANVPNSITTDTKVINKVTTDNNFSVYYDLNDALGNAIAAGTPVPTSYPASLYNVDVKITSPNRQTDDVVKIWPYGSDSRTLVDLRKLDLVITGAIGTSTITLTDPNARYAPITIVVNVNPVTFTTSTTSVTLDMASTATNTANITLTPVNGFGLFATGAIWLPLSTASNVFPPVGSSGPATIAVDRTNKITLTGTNLGKSILRVYSFNETGLSGYEYVDVEVNVVNSQAIKVTPERFDFNLAAGGIVNGTLKVAGNPVTLATVAVTSSDSNVVTAVSAAGGWYIEAQAVGTAILTVYATDIQGNDWVREVPVTVVNTTAKPTLTASPSSVVLDLKEGAGQKLEETLTFSGPNDTDTVVITSIVCGNPSIATVTDEAPYIVKAVAKGSTTIEVQGTVNGLEADKLYVSVTVNDGTVTTAPGVYINDVKYADGATFYVPNNFKSEKYKVYLVKEDGTKVEDVTLTRSIAKSAKVRKQRLNISGVYIVPTQVFGKTKLTVTPKAGGAATTIELNVARLPEDNDTTEKLDREAPQAGTRGYFFDYITSKPATAYYTQPKFWNFKTSDSKVATVKSNGIIEFKKAGPVTLCATRKSDNKSLVKKFSIDLTVTNEYVNTKSWTAVLTNTKAADVQAALNSQKYPQGTTANAPYDYTEAGYAAMIKYLQENAGDNDVSAVYIGGTITKNGIALPGKTISLVTLAEDLAQVKGKIFLTLNGAGSTLYSSKDAAEATPADIAKVFAAAEAGIKSKATALSGASTNMFWSSQKFYVLSATEKKSQTSVSATKAGEIEEAFIKALTPTDGKFFNGGTSVTLKELYSEIKKQTGKKIGYYPAAVKGVAVGYITP